MSAIDIVELIGNPRTGSRTRALADAIVAELGLGRARVLELAEIVGVSFGAEPARGSGVPEDPFAVVRAARLLVVATPTYKGTYTGLLKVFLDQFPAGALAGVVALPVTVAAAPAHLTAVTAALRALLTELGATVAAGPLAVLEPELGALPEVVRGWADRYAADLLAALSGERVRAGAG